MGEVQGLRAARRNPKPLVRQIQHVWVLEPVFPQERKTTMSDLPEAHFWGEFASSSRCIAAPEKWFTHTQIPERKHIIFNVFLSFTGFNRVVSTYLWRIAAWGSKPVKNALNSWFEAPGWVNLGTVVRDIFAMDVKYKNIASRVFTGDYCEIAGNRNAICRLVNRVLHMFVSVSRIRFIAMLYLFAWKHCLSRCHFKCCCIN